MAKEDVFIPWKCGVGANWRGRWTKL